MVRFHAQSSSVQPWNSQVKTQELSINAGLTSEIGDLGTTVEDVEEGLNTAFALASRWECILLIDEAEVFLATRKPKDFACNGMVAGKYKDFNIVLISNFKIEVSDYHIILKFSSESWSTIQASYS